MRFFNLLKLAVAGIIFLSSVPGYGQGFYTKAGGGYNIGIGSGHGANITITRTGNPQNGTLTTVEEAERVKIKYGKGLVGDVAAGYMFTDLLGAELEVSYLRGGNNKTTFKTFSQSSSFGYDSAITSSYQYARMILVQPSLVFNSRISDKVALYGKFGVLISKGFIIVTSERIGATDSYIEEKYEDGWGYGLQAALGFDAKIASKFALYAELKMCNLVYSPQNLHLEKFIYNGEDITNSQVRDIALKERYTNINGQQHVQLRTDFALGYVGLHFGFKRSF
ncbi:outer membrane beta-barrel protein [Adhaeribacter terreus]|uniref:Outer membrane beta-barrel protein n=1 Tax=Adhaeribacter terreus TaxID=529703 RepID=A0ABW0EDJ3_9BACT